MLLSSVEMVNVRYPLVAWALNSRKSSPEETTALRLLETSRPVDGSCVNTAGVPSPKNGRLM